MKRILVYGDSIPWGLIPKTKFERFDYNKRWPGILQNMLKDEYQIIEECLCARTIDSDDPRPGFEGRNGMAFLPTCLDSQYPLDIVIISLGLNEIKRIYNWTPEQVAKKMGQMVKLVKERKPNFHESKPKFLLLSQPIVNNTGAWGDLWVGSNQKSKQLYEEYKALALKENIDFIDLSSVKVDKNDGVHIDEEGHNLTAQLIRQQLY